MLRKIYFFVHFFVFKQGEEKKPKLCNCITRTAQGTILFQPGGNGIFCSIMWPQKGNSFQNKRLCQNKSPAIFLRSLENYLAIRIMAQCCSPDNRGTKPQQPGEQEANICWDWPLLLLFLFLFKLHTHKNKHWKCLLFTVVRVQKQDASSDASSCTRSLGTDNRHTKGGRRLVKSGQKRQILYSKHNSTPPYGQTLTPERQNKSNKYSTFCSFPTKTLDVGVDSSCSGCSSIVAGDAEAVVQEWELGEGGGPEQRNVTAHLHLRRTPEFSSKLKQKKRTFWWLDKASFKTLPL